MAAAWRAPQWRARDVRWEASALPGGGGAAGGDTAAGDEVEVEEEEVWVLAAMAEVGVSVVAQMRRVVIGLPTRRSECTRSQLYLVAQLCTC